MKKMYGVVMDVWGGNGNVGVRSSLARYVVLMVALWVARSVHDIPCSLLWLDLRYGGFVSFALIV